MNSDEILKSYIPMVDFIAKTYGKNCEVVLHDLRDPNNSIVAIRNNYITGRIENGPITDFALNIIQNMEKYENENYICNYTGKAEKGDKTLRSSTYLIKDNEKNLIGMLCINIDITSLLKARDAIDNLIINDELLNKNKHQNEENFNMSVKDLINSYISQALDEFGTEPSRMTMVEKKDIVKHLKDKDAFRLKGVVIEVAKSLKVSEQTIYRYLKELDRSNQ
jgi:predicted transcriptional regulator YheO